MEDNGNSSQCSVTEVENATLNTNQSHECDSVSATEDGTTAKRKNPFGSLLSLAWKLWEAEQKKCKLAGSSSNTAGGCSVADIFRTRVNVPLLYDAPPYTPFQLPTNVGSTNFQSSVALPRHLTMGTYNGLENVLIGNVRRAANDYSRCAAYSPAVQTSNSTLTTGSAPKDIPPATTMPPNMPRWGDNVVFDSDDSAQEDDLRLSERRKHQCHMCSYQTDNKSHMLRHQATAHDACKLYHCYICKMDFSRSERAKSHFLSIHPEIPYHSKMIRKRPHDMAGRAFPISDGRFGGGESGISKISGDPGGAGVIPAPGRKSWEKYCRLVPPLKSSGCYFRCVRCSHVGPDIWHLKRHFLSAHSGTNAYSCRVCRYSTGDMQRLIGHMTGHGELFCHQCSFSTVELERFKEHLAVCTGEAETQMDSAFSQCPVCGEHFEDNCVVKRHVSDTHQRDYCEFCACVIYGPETIEEHTSHHHADHGGTTDSASFNVQRQRANLTTAGEDQTTPKDDGQDYNASVHPDNSDMTKEVFEMAEEEVQQSKYRFGRFSNQTYYCPVDGCPFKATWKKSIELHTLNYHTDVSVDDHGELAVPAAVQSSSPDLASATAPVAISGLFNCPFCPNCRTFKYRKSYEKHLLQHGVDYVKHPYLVVRSSQKDDAAIPSTSMSLL